MRRCDNVGMHDLVIRGGKVVDGTGAAPVTADVAIDGDQVVAVGQVDQAGTREIEADGALVTPGWVDVHTHYDGQATWDPVMRPSIDHGVTTAVMGNCGVGFAPVRPGGEAFLIELMEAIEDIPGTALHEGIDWRWETFGEYIDALAEMPRTLDLGTTVPHAAVRAYVLGDRCHEYDVDAAEIGEIARVMADGVRAGALGVGGVAGPPRDAAPADRPPHRTSTEKTQSESRNSKQRAAGREARGPERPRLGARAGGQGTRSRSP